MKKNYHAIITKKELDDFKKRLVCMGGYKAVALESGYYIEKISRDYGVIGKYDEGVCFMVFENTTVDDLKLDCKKRGIPWFNPLF